MFKALVSRPIAAAIVAAALVILPIQRAAAARSWTAVGRHGGVWSGTVSSYHNGGGNFGRTTTTTRPNGKTRTTTFNRSVSNGTITDSRTVTGYNGATRTATVTRTPQY